MREILASALGRLVVTWNKLKENMWHETGLKRYARDDGENWMNTTTGATGNHRETLGVSMFDVVSLLLRAAAGEKK